MLSPGVSTACGSCSAFSQYEASTPCPLVVLVIVLGLQELANRANDLGLEYGLEVVNRYETNIANTAYQVNNLSESLKGKAGSFLKIV